MNAVEKWARARWKKIDWKEARSETLKTGLLLIAILALRSSIVSTYVVPTGSMMPTILPGDRFLASEFSYGWRLPFLGTRLEEVRLPAHGDIAVFPSPVDPDIFLVKRVVGVAGDRIAVTDGRITLNGRPLPLESMPKDPEEPTLDRYWETLGSVRHVVQFDYRSPSLRDFPSIELKPGEFFVMGDNRDHSADSRYFGPVRLDALKARAWRILFSWDSSEFPFLRVRRFGAGMYN